MSEKHIHLLFSITSLLYQRKHWTWGFSFLLLPRSLCTMHLFRLCQVVEYLFYEVLCLAVRICAATNWMSLIQRQSLRVSIHCGRTGEDDVVDTKLSHHLQPQQRPHLSVLFSAALAWFSTAVSETLTRWQHPFFTDLRQQLLSLCRGINCCMKGTLCSSQQPAASSQQPAASTQMRHYLCDAHLGCYNAKVSSVYIPINVQMSDFVAKTSLYSR